MNPVSGPPQGVPTLTEVIDWHDDAGPASAPEGSAGNSAVADPASAATPVDTSESKLPSEAELIEQVLVQVQRQLDLMIEYRMREALTPLLARATDNLVRDARNELASTLRDVVARAVAQELTRHRNR